MKCSFLKFDLCRSCSYYGLVRESDIAVKLLHLKKQRKQKYCFNCHNSFNVYQGTSQYCKYWFLSASSDTPLNFDFLNFEPKFLMPLKALIENQECQLTKDTMSNKINSSLIYLLLVKHSQRFLNFKPLKWISTNIMS